MKWLNPNRERAKSTKKRELRLAKELGGSRVPRSGAARWSRHVHELAGGDVTAPQFHFESKSTVKFTIAVDCRWLDKIRGEASACNKHPALILTYERGTSPEDWVAVPMDIFRRMMDRYDES